MSQSTYNRTTSSGSSMRITNSGAFYRYVSSSKRYKNYIEDIKETDIQGLYSLPVRTFIYNSDYLSSDDERYGKRIPGLIAEEVEDVLPIAVNHNPDGSAEVWNIDILVPCLLKMIQDSKKKIDSLESIINKYWETKK